MLSVYFSLDGTRFVTAGTDGTARVWRSDGTGEPIVLKGHEGKVIDAFFSPDGKHVVTAGADGTTRIWRITWPDLLEVLRSATTACLTILQRRMYLGGTSCRKDSMGSL
jgi:WD40 repeat protein